MLKYECNEGKQKIEVQGSLEEVLADLTLLIEAIYNEIKDKRAREFFDYALKKLVEDKLYKKSAEEMDELALETMLKALTKMMELKKK